jgi:hypothetical protein
MNSNTATANKSKETGRPTADEYRDHQFVKIAEQLTKNVTLPASTKFEVILENYDKIRAIKAKRELTRSEERIYDKAHRYVTSEFDAMFKRAEPMVSELRKRVSATPVQRGGQDGAPAASGEAAAPAAPGEAAPAAPGEAAPAAPGEAAAPAASGEAAAPGEAAAETKGTQPPAPAAAETKNDAKKEGETKDAKNDEKNNAATDAAVANVASKTLAKAQGAPIETQTQDMGTQATEKKSSETQTKKETPWAENFRFLIWIWDGIKYVFNKIISFFSNTVDDKMRALMKYFSVENLMSMLGDNLDSIKHLSKGITEQIAQLQKSIVGGISGAATASIDMILNAFSMMPVIGTTILVWRMFQNMLVIMGATLSVQAGKETASGAVAAASGASPSDASNFNNKTDKANPSTDGNGGQNEVKNQHKTTDKVEEKDTAPKGAAAAPEKGAAAAASAGTETKGAAPAEGAAAASAGTETKGAAPAATATVGGGGGGKRMRSKQMARTLKKSTMNFKRSLKRFVELRPAPLVTRVGGGGVYSMKRELAGGSKYAAASGLFSGYAAL